MVRTLLIPLDSSTLAERVLSYIKPLAGPKPRRIVLVEAVPSAGETGPEAFEKHVEARREAEAYLDGIVARLGSEANVADVETFVRDGEAAPVILAEVD